MYDLGQREFNFLRKLIFEKSGISLNNGKLDLVRTRLTKRLRHLNVQTFKEYSRMLSEQPDGPEIFNMLDAISTNKTSFFREPQHFDFLNKTALPRLIKEKEKTRDKVFRLWSAGCSTGEEPYTLAITLLEFLQKYPSYKIEILATDLSTQVLKMGITGVFEKNRTEGIPPLLFRKYFLQGKNKWKGYYKVKQELSKIVHFERFNLMQDNFSFSFPFDIVFCRNVMIYFEKKTQENLINKFYSVIKPGHYLLIGHSESLMGVKHKFGYVQPTIYIK